jgi:hypothetical protein
VISTQLRYAICDVETTFEAQPAPTKTAFSSLDRIAAEFLQNALGSASSYTPRRGTLPSKILKALEKDGAAMQVKDISAAVKNRGVLVSQS